MILVKTAALIRWSTSAARSYWATKSTV